MRQILGKVTMARRSRKEREQQKKVDPFERVRLKKLRSAERRAERKRLRDSGEVSSKTKEPPRASKWHDPNNFEWLGLNSVRMVANKIMNEAYREPAPYWLSVPKDPRPEQTNFYPCRSFERGDRVWYGFLFRAHRDEQLRIWGNRAARKELTEDARGR
jgi:hypothetical protein